MADPIASPNPETPTPADPNPLRSVHTTTLVELLKQGGFSFLVSTYQAGKLIVVRADGAEVNTHFRNFHTPMAGHDQAGWPWNPRPFGSSITSRCAGWSPLRHDACFLPRRDRHREIGIHDVAWAGNELWVVNTRLCLCAQPRWSFVRGVSLSPTMPPTVVTSTAGSARSEVRDCPWRANTVAGARTRPGAA